MSHRHRRYSKRELLGSLHVDYVMSVTDLGLRWQLPPVGRANPGPFDRVLEPGYNSTA